MVCIHPSACRHPLTLPPCASLGTRLQQTQNVRQQIVCRDTTDAAPALESPSGAVLVSALLAQVEKTDGGINMLQEQRAAADRIIDQLEAIGSTQHPRPLDNPLLFGNYNVAYTSTSRAPTERGQPAGGRFRGRIGRMLFRTTGVFQSVISPDIATNKVSFKLFGLLPGAVGLRGKVVPVDAGQPHGQGIAGERDTVKVLFEPPVLSLGNSLHLRIGPPSSVQLSTPYLDERVRLGKGSRGSLFVFTKGGPADAAGMDQVGLEKSTKSGLAWLAAAFAAMVASGCALWATGAAGLKVVAAGMWLITALMAAVLQQGGIIRDDDDIQRVQQMMEQQQQKQQQQQQQAEKEVQQQVQEAAKEGQGEGAATATAESAGTLQPAAAAGTA